MGNRTMKADWYKQTGSHRKGTIEYAHRLRAMKALGHALPPKAVVHHVDGTKGVSSPLVICQDTAYHWLLHNRTNVLRAGGNPNTQKLCRRCRTPKDFSAFYRQRLGAYGRFNVCKVCSSELHVLYVNTHRDATNEYQRRRRRLLPPS
jgi:hypothetical protein